MSARWEPAFLAMSAALGEPHDDALAALGDAGMLHATEMARALRSKKREVRAKAIASELAIVARDLDEARLSWR
jgi:hypothetical protein